MAIGPRPARLGPYEVLGELGEGGMARVYEGRDAAGHRVAIKVLKDDLSGSSEVLHRFVREARIMQELDHPCIVRVYAVGPPEPPAWFSMEKVEGTGLDAMMAEGKGVPDEVGVRVLDDVLAALDHAHARGIVHRDLKPENVLVRPDGRAMLTDFGIAKVVEGTQLTLTGARLGTPHYMAPEQVRGKRSMGPPVDVYAAGVLAYEMLCGHTPFQGEDPVAIGYCHNYEPPPPLKRRGKAVPEELAALVMKALEKKPTARWRSAGTMRKALQKAARKLGFELASVADEPEGTEGRPARIARTSVPLPHAIVAPGARHPAPPEAVNRVLLAGLLALAGATVVLNLDPRVRPGQSADPRQVRRARQLFLDGLESARRAKAGAAVALWRRAAEADPTLLPVVRDHAEEACRAALAGRDAPAARLYLEVLRWADPGYEPGLALERELAAPKP